MGMGKLLLAPIHLPEGKPLSWIWWRFGFAFSIPNGKLARFIERFPDQLFIDIA